MLIADKIRLNWLCNCTKGKTIWEIDFLFGIKDLEIMSIKQISKLREIYKKIRKGKTLPFWIERPDVSEYSYIHDFDK